LCAPPLLLLLSTGRRRACARAPRLAFGRQNCTIALAVLATEAFLDQPFPFFSGVCRIEHRFVHIPSGAGADAARTFAGTRDRAFAHGRIVRSGFNQSDLFALALTLTFPARLALFVDLEAFERFDNAWIDAAAEAVLADPRAVAAARLHGTAASHAVLVSVRLLRRFLVYTDVHYSAVPAMALLSATAACRGFGHALEVPADHALRPRPATPVACADAPTMQRCPADRRGPRDDVAVMVPAFKRDYMGPLITGVCQQTHRPTRIFILQNAMHVLLNFTRIFSVASVPVAHLWFTNWNSFFYIFYVLIMFVPERFTLKIDDDLIPTDTVSLATFVNAALQQDVIVGSGGAYMNRPACGFNPQIIDNVQGFDHSAFVILYDTYAGKVLHRFSTYSPLGGDDIALSLTNAMECGTQRVGRDFVHNEFHFDGMTHRNDPEIQAGYAKFTEELYDLTYCHFIRAGFRPIAWRNFSHGQTTDIRWPID
jgi:hypothetical protein